MYSLWACLTLAASFVAAPFFMMSERGRIRLGDRFGSWGLSGRDVVWFHGASLGEVNGLIPIMKLWRRSRPDVQILLSCVSPTGLDRGRDFSDFQRLLPFDNPLWLARALKGLRIREVIIAETELWPCWLRELERRGIRVSIVNGKVSDFTFGYYKALKSLFARGITHMDHILTADRESAERFCALGARSERVRFCGNSKYDALPSVGSSEEARRIRAGLFSDELPLLVLGSLRPGEERVWLPAIAQSFDRGLRFNVVVAPRHKEKFDFFAAAIGSAGFRFARRTSGRAAEAGENIILLDTIGELEKVYSAATLAFIGGTIENWGGHNPLEAAAYGAAIALGPHCSNISEIAQALEERGGLVRVRNIADASRAIEILCDRAGAEKVGTASREVWKEHAGSASRIFCEIFGAPAA